MRRLVVGSVVAALLFGACSNGGETADRQSSPAPTSAANVGAEPKTAQQLRSIAQLHFNSFAVGDFETFWGDFDADGKRFISQPEYARRLRACMEKDPNRNKPFRVVGATENRDGTWSVEVRYLNYRIKFPARYENGHWRFSLSPDAKRALRLPISQYLATQCRRG